MRKVFLAINALLTLALIAQLYLAALGHFSQPEDEMFRFHLTNGRIILPLLIILWIVFGFLARIGRKNIGLTFAGLRAPCPADRVLHHRGGARGHAAAQYDDARRDALRPGAPRARRHAAAAAHDLGVLPREEHGSRTRSPRRTGVHAGAARVAAAPTA